jgi:hypothetical protein
MKGIADMASNDHDGIVDSGKTYTTRALARILGVKQPRTVENWLKRYDIAVARFAGRVLVSGKVFQLAIESGSVCLDEEEPVSR